MPLSWYEHIPISKLLANPSAYHLHEIRVAGTVRATHTQVMTQGCGAPYEFTVMSLEDDGGSLEILDRGACGSNRSPLRAPMLATGDRAEFLVHVTLGADTGGKGGALELFALWIERSHQ